MIALGYKTSYHFFALRDKMSWLYPNECRRKAAEWMIFMDFYTHPPEYDLLKIKLHQLKAKYPFVRMFYIGKSVLGRKIYAVGVGNLKHANLLAGAFHGQEWLTATVLVRFLEDFCQSTQDRQVFENTNLGGSSQEKGFIIVPVVNPDGVEIALKGPSAAGQLQKRVKQLSEQSGMSWQANARGIDLNHNFDAHFDLCKQAELAEGILGPGPRKYGGKRPHTEPEVQAIIHLCCTFQIRNAFAFHSQGEEIYYQYGEHTPAASKYIASLLASSCGYQIAVPTGTASHGGFKDWFVEKLRRPGFTIEIGRGCNPLPITDLDSVYQKLKEALLIAAMI